jgi:hypothetical protein
MLIVELPPHDGAIEEALADLDAKLASWTEAMRTAQETLVNTASLQEAGQTSAAVLPSDEPVATAVCPPDDRARAADSGSDAAVPKAASEPPHESTAASYVTEAEAQPLQKSDSEEPVVTISDLNEPQRSRYGFEPAQDDLDPARQAQDDAQHEQGIAREQAAAARAEDEALLATLDDETVKAIRVMRRLDMGKRSVRELLEEYKAGMGATKGPGKSKSWWSRGRE